MVLFRIQPSTHPADGWGWWYQTSICDECILINFSTGTFKRKFIDKLYDVEELSMNEACVSGR